MQDWSSVDSYWFCAIVFWGDRWSTAKDTWPYNLVLTFGQYQLTFLTIKTPSSSLWFPINSKSLFQCVKRKEVPSKGNSRCECVSINLILKDPSCVTSGFSTELLRYRSASTECAIGKIVNHYRASSEVDKFNLWVKNYCLMRKQVRLYNCCLHAFCQVTRIFCLVILRSSKNTIYCCWKYIIKKSFDLLFNLLLKYKD